MIESGFYPPGAEFDPNAPYNQSDPDERSFTCEVMETVSRMVDVTTTKYNVFSETDEDGMYYSELDTSDVNWGEEYDELYYDLPELMKELKAFILGNVDVDRLNSVQRRKMEYLLGQCDGWGLVEREVDEVK